MDENYQIYIKEREQLVKSELNQSQQFDKYILTLSSGIFSLSIVFIEKIAINPEANTIWLLVTSWVVFSLSILSTLTSFLLSQIAYRKQQEILGEWYKSLMDGKDLAEKDRKNIFMDCTGIINWASMAFFVAGVVFLIAFSAINL